KLSYKKAALKKLSNLEATAYWRSKENRSAEQHSRPESQNAGQYGDSDEADGSSDHNEPRELGSTEGVPNDDTLLANPPNTSAVLADLCGGKVITQPSE